MSVFNKAEVIRDLLEEGHQIQIILQAKHPGVVLPPLPEDENKAVILTLSHHFNPLPMRDFSLTDNVLEATLSFNRTPFHCVVPLAAVTHTTVVCDNEVVILRWGPLGPEPANETPSPLRVVK